MFCFDDCGTNWVITRTRKFSNPFQNHEHDLAQIPNGLCAALCHLSVMEKLNSTQIKETLGSVPNWTQKADAISRTFQFKDFPGSIQFVNGLAKIAEEANHHPDIDIRWNKVTLVLSTHDAGGLTEKDFDLAKKIDRL